MAVKFIHNKQEITFTEHAESIVNVDAVTQQALFTGSGKLEGFSISNPSVTKIAWLKPNKNDTNKQGVILKPGENQFITVATSVTWYVIMDGGGSVPISVERFF